MANTFYEVATGEGKDKTISPFTQEEMDTLDTLQGIWVFWKKPHEDRDFDVYYAWKSTWPKECRIIDRNFAAFFNAIVQHEEAEGYSTKSSEVSHGEFQPVSRDESSIPQSQLLKDPAFEIEGEPDDDDDEEVDQEVHEFLHPAWTKGTLAAGEEMDIQEIPENPAKPKTRYEAMMEELSKGNKTPFGRTN